MTGKEIALIILFVIPLLLLQGGWIFLDAKKRGEKYYWLWGLFGIIQVPSSLVIYLVITRIIFKNKDN